MSAQDLTLDRYHALMQTNAEAQLVRQAREIGVFDALQQGQLTQEAIVERLGTDPRLTGLLLDSLVALHVLERYGDDYALSAVMRLLCLHDRTLGDEAWGSLGSRLRGEETLETEAFLDAATATQWVHTGAAKQAAEILDITGERAGRRILDLGCGSAVWSCAMAFADPTATVTAVDTPPRLAAARRTISSIGLDDRYEVLEGDPLEIPLEEEAYDLVVMAGRLSAESPERDPEIFRRVEGVLRGGGELAVIDLFRGPTGPNLTEAVEALRLAVSTPQGHIRDAEAMRKSLLELGFGACQFAFLAASRQGYGLLLAAKKD
ncbi:class I SAM-dependent methyltransferase [Candidatus Laterigemmans baculatus]|uniref:class I SAM-dependent methyltransferase n=1 Tax=Candidatus Laterigemmans baculatus TaxID=2770505 RepID=UPI0013D8F250|nr:class I SAM-dependent methyltransferase [Candidatus Laterigemmans baculatus]